MKPDYSKKLKEFEEYLKEISEIIAVYYTGSTAKKSWDKYSDIDIDVVVKDKDFNKFIKRLPKLLSWWGKIKFINNYPGHSETYAYIGNDYLKVEIDLIKKSWLKGRIRDEGKLKGIRIAFDKEGTLTRESKKAPKLKKQKINHKEAINFFLGIRDNLIYSARHFMRGQRLSGASEIGSTAGSLFIYLGKIKGYKDYENLRDAEKHLTKKEWNFLKISSCKSLKKLEVKRALKANWDFMKYLESLYEKKTKKKLNLKVNDKEILKRVNEIFEE